MKNVLIFILLAAATGLYFHDKFEQEQNAQLVSQVSSFQEELSEKTATLNSLQAKYQQLSAQAGASQPFGRPPAQPQQPQQNRSPFEPQGPMQDDGGLNRPAYRN